MQSHRIRTHLLAGGVLAVLALGARGGDCGAPCAAPCAPAFRTVCCTEWVPENYVTTRTVYKTECVQEKYTAYRTECVAEQRSCTYTCNRLVPEWREEVRTCCVSVPVVETRTCMKPVWTCKEVTTVCRKCVDQGHWECREVPCRESCLTKLKKHCHKNDCCYCEPCPPTKLEKVWVPCKVWVECPVTKLVRTCEYVATPVQVTVCKMVEKKEVVKVCCYRCVAEQKTSTYTVMVPRCVAFEATRTVARCVPVQEQVTCCRMVARTVQKQVPCCETCCYTPCCESSKKHGFFHKAKGCCH